MILDHLQGEAELFLQLLITGYLDDLAQVLVGDPGIVAEEEAEVISGGPAPNQTEVPLEDADCLAVRVRNEFHGCSLPAGAGNIASSEVAAKG
jgi:hypothetical protein